MDKYRIIIGTLILLAISCSVNALDCVHNDVIQLQLFDTIDFYCEVDDLSNDKCIGMIFDDQSLIYSFPTDDMLAIDKYVLTNGIGKITFDINFLSKYMQSDREFTYAVICGDEFWQNDILTEYKDYTNQTVMVGVWMKNNLNYIVLLFIGLFVLVVTIGLIWKVSK